VSAALFFAWAIGFFTGEPDFIFMGMSVLYATLSAFLMACGILADLIYKTGNLKMERLSLLTAELRDGVGGPD
jgi:hypothetical protein